jgi:hypothetical protein
VRFLLRLYRDCFCDAALPHENTSLRLCRKTNTKQRCILIQVYYCEIYSRIQLWSNLEQESGSGSGTQAHKDSGGAIFRSDVTDVSGGRGRGSGAGLVHSVSREVVHLNGKCSSHGVENCTIVRNFLEFSRKKPRKLPESVSISTVLVVSSKKAHIKDSPVFRAMSLTL